LKILNTFDSKLVDVVGGRNKNMVGSKQHYLMIGERKLIQGSKEFGFCDLHEELTDEVTYRYKGCWGCQHFEFGQTCPYLFVSEAAEELMDSENTIRRLIKKDKLEGELFEQ
jgi:hypothetical protein